MNKAFIPLLRALLIFVSALLLGACEESREDLQVFVNKVKAKPVRRLDPLPEPKTYEPIPYEQEQGRNPFAPVALLVIETKKKTSTFHPDFSREKQELEAFSLRDLRLVGTLKKAGVLVGLVRTPEAEVVIVRKGNYIGKNFGLVKSVSDAEIELREIVKDNDGLWQKRETRFGFEE